MATKATERPTTPGMAFSVRPMAQADVRQVAEIERQAFPTLFPPTPFRRELAKRNASYLVAFEDGGAAEHPGSEGAPVDRPGRVAGLARLAGSILGRSSEIEETIAGFIGLWYMVDEAHVVSVGVGDGLPGLRNRRASAHVGHRAGPGPAGRGGHSRGEAVQQRCHKAVRQVWVHGAGPPKGLLLGQSRGRSHHDDGSHTAARLQGTAGCPRRGPWPALGGFAAGVPLVARSLRAPAPPICSNTTPHGMVMRQIDSVTMSLSLGAMRGQGIRAGWGVGAAATHRQAI